MAAAPDPLALAFLRTDVELANLVGPEIYDERVYSTTRKRLEHRFGFWTSAHDGPVYYVVVRYAYRDYTGRRHLAEDSAWAIYEARTLAGTDAGGDGHASTAGLGPPVVLRP